MVEATKRLFYVWKSSCRKLDQDTKFNFYLFSLVLPGTGPYST